MEKIREAEFLTPQKMEKRSKINFTENQKKRQKKKKKTGKIGSEEEMTAGVPKKKTEFPNCLTNRVPLREQSSVIACSRN
jgi:hypothetical protein